MTTHAEHGAGGDRQVPDAFRTLRELLLRRRGLLVGAIAAAAGAQLAGIPFALLTRKLVERAADVRAWWFDPWWLVGVLLLLIGVQACGRWWGMVAAERAAQGMLADLRARMLRVLLRRRAEQVERRASGKSLVRFLGDAGGLRGWVERAVVRTPADALTVIAVLSTLAVIRWQFAVVALVPLLGTLLIAVALGRPIRAHTRTVRLRQTLLAGEITEHLDRTTAVRAGGAEDDSVEVVERQLRAVESGFVARRRLDALAVISASVGGAFAVGSIGVVGAYLATRGDAALGEVMVSIWLALLLRGPTRRLGNAYSMHQRARVSGERIEALLATVDRDGRGARYAGTMQRIRCKQLGIRDSAGRWLVRGLTAAFDGPGVVYVVGGAEQRNALFEAFLCLRHPDEGRLGLDGTNARKLRDADVRERIGWLDGRREVARTMLSGSTAALVERSWGETTSIAPHADRVGFQPLVQSPDLQDAAAALRLELSCALARDPKVVLLDDPARGLEEATRARLQQWIEQLASARLVLVGVDRVAAVPQGVGHVDLADPNSVRVSGDPQRR
ncbi:MAG: hypothetical protein KDC87_20890, partial [Planctomycetes bacterium]|nr:hypothetical protein [Planctomycetota bacterium]